MTVRVGINGFGRIGRTFLRAVLARGEEAGIDVAAINDPGANVDALAYLLQHDSVFSVLPETVETDGESIAVGNHKIAVRQQPEPAAVPWGDHGVDVVIESSGLFRARAAAAGHLANGARRVIVSAPSHDADVTICIGVNDDRYDPARHTVVSCASCTTNCLAPMLRVLHEGFGVQQGFMTTVHAYTTGQALLDLAHEGRSGKTDLRRMRAAPLSIVPTSTGATRAIGAVLPELDGRLDGLALRVPVPDGSIVDLVAITESDVTRDAVNDAFATAAADASYRRVLRCTDQLLVSEDIVGDPSSCVFSAADTSVHGRGVKVLGWYDNEWGYSNRLVDAVQLVHAAEVT